MSIKSKNKIKLILYFIASAFISLILYTNAVLTPGEFQISHSSPILPTLENVKNLDFSSVESIKQYLRDITPPEVPKEVVSELIFKNISSDGGLAGSFSMNKNNQPEIEFHIPSSAEFKNLDMNQRMEGAVNLGHEFLHYLNVRNEIGLGGNLLPVNTISQTGSNANVGYGGEFIDGGAGYGSNSSSQWYQWQMSEIHAYAWQSAAYMQLSSQYLAQYGAMSINQNGKYAEDMSHNMGSDLESLLKSGIDNSNLSPSQVTSNVTANGTTTVTFNTGNIKYTAESSGGKVKASMSMPNPNMPNQAMMVVGDNLAIDSGTNINTPAAMQSVVSAMNTQGKSMLDEIAQLKYTYNNYNLFQKSYDNGLHSGNPGTFVLTGDEPDLVNKIGIISELAYKYGEADPSSVSTGLEAVANNSMGFVSKVGNDNLGNPVDITAFANEQFKNAMAAQTSSTPSRSISADQQIQQQVQDAHDKAQADLNKKAGDAQASYRAAVDKAYIEFFNKGGNGEDMYRTAVAKGTLNETIGVVVGIWNQYGGAGTAALGQLNDQIQSAGVNLAKEIGDYAKKENSNLKGNIDGMVSSYNDAHSNLQIQSDVFQEYEAVGVVFSKQALPGPSSSATTTGANGVVTLPDVVIYGTFDNNIFVQTGVDFLGSGATFRGF